MWCVTCMQYSGNSLSNKQKSTKVPIKIGLKLQSFPCVWGLAMRDLNSTMKKDIVIEFSMQVFVPEFIW